MPTNIEWTGESWNPIRARTLDGKLGWHCEHASPGCQNCYAETQNEARRFDLGTGLPYKPGHRKDVEVFLDEAALVKPLGWKKGRKVFVCSMTDLFADFVTDAIIDRIFAVMALCPQHTFQVLTKRSARMREYLLHPARPELLANIVLGCAPDRWGVTGEQRLAALGGRATEQQESFVPMPLPNIWLGVSVEDQQRADERIPDLLATPAATRWISAEPLLGPVDLNRIVVGHGGFDAASDAPPEWKKIEKLTLTVSAMIGVPSLDWGKLDWVVAGGESGKGARPMHPDWARSLRDQCAAADAPFFFKQWGEWGPFCPGSRKQPVACDGGVMDRYGKKNTGRKLDGVLHDGMPGQ